jgi:HK97 family phage prohead protease
VRLSYATSGVYRVKPGFLELRTDAQGNRRLVGYCATYNTWSCELPLDDDGDETFIETIRRGAFSNSLSSGQEIVCTINHNLDRQIATTGDGSLKLSDDRIGLYAEIKLDDSRDGKAAYLIAAEGKAGASFTFVPVEDKWKRAKDGSITRTLIEVEISECCITNAPCYEATWLNVDESKRSVVVPIRSVNDSYKRLRLALAN